MVSEHKKVFQEKLTTLEPLSAPNVPMTGEGGTWELEQPSGASTPNLSEAVDQIKRSLSITALQDLSAKTPSEVGRSIQKTLWRPHDDEARIPSDWERLLVHVIRAGSRSFMLSYGLRSTFTFIITLIKSLRRRTLPRRDQLMNALVGEATVRFALAFGVWTAVYKFVNNALRLLTPYPKGSSGRKALKRRATAPAGSIVNESDDGLTLAANVKKKEERKKLEWKHLSAYDPRVRSWHAYAAGAVSSVAFLLESQGFVRALGLQLFVRGLEGSYRHLRAKGIVDIPHGAIILFGLANVQILMSWLGAPQFLDPSYKSWIDKASGLPKACLNTYFTTHYFGEANPWALVELLGGEVPEPISTNPLRFADIPPTKQCPKGITGRTVAQVFRWMEKGDPSHFPTCALSHAHSHNHLYVTYENFMIAWKFIMPVYLTLYVVPAVFLRPGALMKNPKTVLVKSLLGASRSSAFLGVYVVIAKAMFCFLHYNAEWLWYGPYGDRAWAKKLARVLLDHRMKALQGAMTGLALLVEHRRRRSELTAYVLPKALESFWKQGRAKGYLPYVPYGEYLIATASLSMIMGTYAHNPENLSHLVSRVIYQFIGRN